MAVYKRRYNPYTGSIAAEWSRFLVLTRYAIADLFKSRFFVVFLILCFVPALFFAGYIFIANNKTLQVLLQMRSAGLLSVESQFFVTFLATQTQLAFLLNCWVGPVLIAGDLTNGALPLFLSRPFSRAEYVLGKFSVLAVLLSAVTWLPCLLLFSLQAGLAKGGWIWSHLWMIVPIVSCSAIWILMLSLIALAMSAWVKWRNIATAGIFAAFLVPAGFGGIFNATLKTDWGHLVNFTYLFRVVLLRGFRMESALAGYERGHAFPGLAAWGMMILVCVLALVMLNARLRPREVVRG
jgi:ABC-2 type transport system permease protein